MKKQKLIFAIMLLLTGCGTAAWANDFILFGQNSQNSQPPEHTTITAQAAAQIMANQTDIIILDVRTRQEFNTGHIPNAVLLPVEDLQADTQKVLQLVPSYGTTILIYCRSGRRSATAAEIIASLGYTAVYDFGGILDWYGEIVVE